LQSSISQFYSLDLIQDNDCEDDTQIKKSERDFEWTFRIMHHINWSVDKIDFNNKLVLDHLWGEF
jgi:hypothetical protein